MTTPNPPEGEATPQQDQPQTPGEAWKRVKDQWTDAKAQFRDAAAKAQRSRKRPAELTIWQWTLVPVILACIPVLIASRGDSDTARALLQNLNVPAIFIATILPLLAAAAVVLFAMAVIVVIDQFRNRDQPEQQVKGRNEWQRSLGSSLILFVFAGIFLWFAMPWRSVLITGGVVGVLIVVFAVKWLNTKLDTLFTKIGGVYVATLILVAIAITLAQTGVWLPRERLALGWFRTGTVYVLSSDDRWTKYVDDATRQVHIVKTETITQRDAVHDDKNNWLNQTPSEWFSG